MKDGPIWATDSYTGVGGQIWSSSKWVNQTHFSLSWTVYHQMHGTQQCLHIFFRWQSDPMKSRNLSLEQMDCSFMKNKAAILLFSRHLTSLMERCMNNKEDTPIHLLLWFFWFPAEKPYCFQMDDVIQSTPPLAQIEIGPTSRITYTKSVTWDYEFAGTQERIYTYARTQSHKHTVTEVLKTSKQDLIRVLTTHESPMCEMKDISFLVNIAVAVEPDSSSSPFASSLDRRKKV